MVEKRVLTTAYLMATIQTEMHRIMLHLLQLSTAAREEQSTTSMLVNSRITHPDKVMVGMISRVDLREQ